MKKVMFTMVMFAVVMICNAQLIKKDFMDGISIGNGIEKGVYASTSDPVMLNQWNRGVRNTDGANPLAVAPLTYSGYSESGVSNAFTLAKLGSGSRLTGYSLTESNTYGTGAYYLAFMIKVNSGTIAGANVGAIMFDGSYASDYQRGVVNVQTTASSTSRTATCFGLSKSDGSGAIYQNWTDSIQMGTTAFLVLKHDFTEQKTSLYVNPSPAGEEPLTPDLTVDNADLTVIKAITVRQRTNHSCTIGGLRFAQSWASAVGQNNDMVTALSAASTVEKAITATDYFTISGLKVQKISVPGIYIRKDYYEDGTVTVEKVKN